MGSIKSRMRETLSCKISHLLVSCCFHSERSRSQWEKNFSGWFIIRMKYSKIYIPKFGILFSGRLKTSCLNVPSLFGGVGYGPVFSVFLVTNWNSHKYLLNNYLINSKSRQFQISIWIDIFSRMKFWILFPGMQLVPILRENKKSSDVGDPISGLGYRISRFVEKRKFENRRNSEFGLDSVTTDPILYFRVSGGR